MVVVLVLVLVLMLVDERSRPEIWFEIEIL